MPMNGDDVKQMRDPNSEFRSKANLMNSSNIEEVRVKYILHYAQSYDLD